METSCHIITQTKCIRHNLAPGFINETQNTSITQITYQLFRRKGKNRSAGEGEKLPPDHLSAGAFIHRGFTPLQLQTCEHTQNRSHREGSHLNIALINRGSMKLSSRSTKRTSLIMLDSCHGWFRHHHDLNTRFMIINSGAL